MSQPEEKAIIPEVAALAVPTMLGGVEEYSSSEEFQRAHRVALEEQKKEEETRKVLTDKQRLRVVLDKYITKYSKTSEVRKMATANKKSADHQLDVCADVVEILEKIKNELR